MWYQNNAGPERVNLRPTVGSVSKVEAIAQIIRKDIYYQWRSDDRGVSLFVGPKTTGVNLGLSTPIKNQLPITKPITIIYM